MRILKLNHFACLLAKSYYNLVDYIVRVNDGRRRRVSRSRVARGTQALNYSYSSQIIRINIR